MERILSFFCFLSHYLSFFFFFYYGLVMGNEQLISKSKCWIRKFYRILKAGKILLIKSYYSIILTISKNCSYYEHSIGGWASMPPSSSGLGHLSFKEATGIRLPLGVGYYERKLIIDRGLSINNKDLNWFFLGRCPSG